PSYTARSRRPRAEPNSGREARPRSDLPFIRSLLYRQVLQRSSSTPRHASRGRHGHSKENRTSHDSSLPELSRKCAYLAVKGKPTTIPFSKNPFSPGLSHYRFI